MSGSGKRKILCNRSLCHQNAFRLIMEEGLSQMSLVDKSKVPVISLDLEAVKAELLVKCRECQERGLTQSFKWLAEIIHSLK